ncbi:hypothetical protein IW150_000342 [Coemansia sp. RSA 2607]|nr:hypothetical protein IW150_000342 [Coemansia sp. RSA 2607]
MTSFISRVPRKFSDVDFENGIDTVQFIEAATGVVMLFDELGSAAFTVVKSDISGNIEKIRTKHASNPAEFSTLQKIVLAEAGTKDRTATQGLLWLKRGLEFTAEGISRNLENKSDELSKSFTEAYEKTLKQFHNFIVKGVFNVAMMACPARADFYKKLGDSEEAVTPGLQEWVQALQNLLRILNAFYEQGNYGKGL